MWSREQCFGLYPRCVPIEAVHCVLASHKRVPDVDKCHQWRHLKLTNQFVFVNPSCWPARSETRALCISLSLSHTHRQLRFLPSFPPSLLFYASKKWGKIQVSERTHFSMYNQSMTAPLFIRISGWLYTDKDPPTVPLDPCLYTQPLKRWWWAISVHGCGWSVHWVARAASKL